MLEPANPVGLLASLKARATALLEEFRQFQAFLQTQNTTSQKSVNEFGRQFRQNLESEVKNLAQVCIPADNRKLQDHDEEQLERSRALHILQSTNLTFYEAVWDAAKRSRAVIALERRISRNPRSDAGSSVETKSKRDLKLAQKKTILVDVVADDGLEWTKVSTITSHRLLFEIAQEGWEKYSEESDSDGSTRKPDLKLIRCAEDLRAASLQVRVRYQHPRVLLLLPQITEGMYEDIDAILQDIRAKSVIVQCSESTELDRPEGQASTTTILSKFNAMLPSRPDPLTKIINVDSTILLSLISDISHVHPSMLSDPSVLPGNRQSHHKAILQQISEEERSALLPTELYPLLLDRKLVCTVHAAKRVCKIVDTMGTPTERIRTSLIFGRGQYASMDEKELLRELQQHSVHSVPYGLSMAVTQVDFEPEDAFLTSPSELAASPISIARRASDNMNCSSINKSVFLYGWRENITTVTSNRTVAGRLVQAINNVLNDQEQEGPVVEAVVSGQQENFRGPELWICETARSLIGKTKSNGPALDS
jgi:hypothetical protein